MSDFDESPPMIDGFSSVRAIRRAQKKKKKTAGGAEGTGDSSPEPVEGGNDRPPVHIDHTVLPDKHEVICYECDYAFVMPGRIQDTLCPKCHRPLKTRHFVIDAEWTETIKTIGTVELKPTAVLNGAEIRARDVILEGNAENGSIRALRRLELCPGARFTIARVKMRDLVVRTGGVFDIPAVIACRDLEVEGTLTAKIFADGVARVRNGGCLNGELHVPHLIMEDGCRVTARLVVGLGKGPAKETDAAGRA